MSNDTVRVRVAGPQFRYEREQYTEGDELDVPEWVIESHPQTLERVAPTASSETTAEQDADSEVDPDEIDPHPTELTVDEIKERIADVDDVATLEAILELEERGENRSTATDAIENRIDDLEG
jgi:DNA topoisomerase VI subunit B